MATTAGIDWFLGEAMIDLDSAIGNLETAERNAKEKGDERWREVARVLRYAVSARRAILDVEVD